MKKWTALIAVLLALLPTAALCKEKVLVHVSSVKREYLGDKPTKSDCKSEPCTIQKETLKVRVGKTRMTLTCETWISLRDVANASHPVALTKGRPNSSETSYMWCYALSTEDARPNSRVQLGRSRN
jgi:hypothetical protein